MVPMAEQPDSDPNTRVLRDLCRWLAEGRDAWLCTIARTWGSSPRPAGSMLAINSDGDWSGSVSGGCLEEELIQQAREQIGGDDPVPRVVEYGVSESDQQRWQLPCGGTIRLIVEPLSAERDLAHFSGLLGLLDDRQSATRRLVLETGEKSLLDQPGATALEEGGGCLYHTLGPQSRMLLIGAGEVARYVARIARMNEFAVSLCEPREAFLQGWSEPGVTVHERLPDDLINEDFRDRHCAILALGHDPRIDDMGLLAALKTEAFYIGAMGSQRTAAQRRERLHQLGVTDTRMGRIHAPIGFHIGSKAPPEIAVAIMAQVLAERYRLLRRLTRN